MTLMSCATIAREYYLYAQAIAGTQRQRDMHLNHTEDHEAQWQRAAQWLRNRANKLLDGHMTRCSCQVITMETALSTSRMSPS